MQSTNIKNEPKKKSGEKMIHVANSVHIFNSPDMGLENEHKMSVSIEARSKR